MFSLFFQEMQALLDLGDAIETMVKNYAIKYIKAEIIKRTVLASLWSALWPLGLLKIAQVVDNPFSIAKARADKAGLVLADAIAQRAQGKRPISLVGYSLGARVIYACLLSLAERKVFGMIENVVLMGAPTPSNAESWGLIRGVVSGRVVNAYAEDDWVLGFLYRTSAIQLGVAGLQKIEGVEGVENVDVSDIVDGHLKYAERATEIVGRVLDADVKEIQMVH
jgi:pimeloyl-ACP methyl ester carboxylesterase